MWNYTAKQRGMKGSVWIHLVQCCKKNDQQHLVTSVSRYKMTLFSLGVFFGSLSAAPLFCLSISDSWA